MKDPAASPPTYPEALDEFFGLLVSPPRFRALTCQELRDGSLSSLAGAQPCRGVLLVLRRLRLQHRRPFEQLSFRE